MSLSVSGSVPEKRWVSQCGSGMIATTMVGVGE